MSTKLEFLVIQSFERGIDSLKTKGEKRRTLLWCQGMIEDKLLEIEIEIEIGSTFMSKTQDIVSKDINNRSKMELTDDGAI